MSVRFVIFFIILLLLAPLGTLAGSAQSAVSLQVVVSQNVRVYFDGRSLVAQTNDSMPAVITRDDGGNLQVFQGAQQKTQALVYPGFTYTIVPSL